MTEILLDESTLSFLEKEGQLESFLKSVSVVSNTNINNNLDEETKKLLEQEGQLEKYLELFDKDNKNKDNKDKDNKDKDNKDKDNKDFKDSKNVDEYFIEELYIRADDIGPMTVCRPSILLPLEINGTKVKAILDTGAQVNTISIDLVKKLGLESFVDKTRKGVIKGVGTSKMFGYIPCITVSINGAECDMDFFVIELSCRTEMLISMSFMLFHQVILDFNKKTMSIGGKTEKLIIEDG